MPRSKNNVIALSASRLKMFKDCSWLYYCRYILKLPDKSNTGALKGSCCHTIFECLLKPRHHHFHAEITSPPASIRNSPVIDRYVKSYMRKNNLKDSEYNMIDSMTVVGLMYDFYCAKGQGQELKAEQRFDIVNEHPSYRIKGFMDKIAKYSSKSLLRIVDYKSSKRQFDGDDLTSNVQAMIYSIAAKKIFPDLVPIVEFIFLQFPEKPVQRLRFSDASLRGFEEYLAKMSKLINNFSAADAKKNFAADKPMPKGEFSGPLLCGFAKTAGQLKKDGTPMWHCAYKFPFSYYSLCDENDEVVRTSYENDLVPNKKKGEYVIRKHYSGCPAFSKRRPPANPNDSF